MAGNRKRLNQAVHAAIASRRGRGPATAKAFVGKLQEKPRGASQLRIELVERRASSEADLMRTFAPLKKGDVDGALIVSTKLATNFPGRLAGPHHPTIGARAADQVIQ